LDFCKKLSNKKLKQRKFMTSTGSKKNQNQNSWKGLLVWILIALLLRWQAVEPRWIPSGSMIPTLQIQDRILIEKITPRLNNKLNKHLNLNTIVIFKPPKILTEAGYSDGSALIKRVVGLPGDKIEVTDGKLYRNGKEINEPWIKEPIQYEMEAINVPEYSLWVLGDNRNNSLDSHVWGALPEKNLIGTALARYWPLKKIGPIRFP
jgi:signal peptidase I